MHALASGGAGGSADGSATARRWRRRRCDDIERLRGDAEVEVGRRGAPADLRAVAARPPGTIVRATGKPGDGLVSRWLNRPISQRITWLVLAMPGARPIHVTIFNALLALVMSGGCSIGGETGLIARRHPLPGRLGARRRRRRDGARDLPHLRRGRDAGQRRRHGDQFLFVLGITVHLGLRDGPARSRWIGLWAIGLMVIGAVLIGGAPAPAGRRSASTCSSARGRSHRRSVDLIYWVVQMLTGRDFFAFLFMVLILVGLERVALSSSRASRPSGFVYVFALAAAPVAERAYRGAA